MDSNLIPSPAQIEAIIAEIKAREKAAKDAEEAAKASALLAKIERLQALTVKRARRGGPDLTPEEQTEYEDLFEEFGKQAGLDPRAFERSL